MFPVEIFRQYCEILKCSVNLSNSGIKYLVSKFLFDLTDFGLPSDFVTFSLFFISFINLISVFSGCTTDRTMHDLRISYLRFSDVFRGYRSGTLGVNGLIEELKV